MKRMSKKKKKLRAVRISLLVVFLGVFCLLIFYCRKLSEKMDAEQARKPAGPLVCVDAGHGGADTGALGEGGRYEKDDNLKLAKAVKEELEKRNIRVVMTREDDTKVSLQGRCDIANDAGAVLFVSLHRNSASAAAAKGVEIWTANKGRGARMAGYILDGLREAGIQEDRGVQEGTSSSDKSDYYINKHTTMPSCLAEMGFITNEEDNRLFDENLDRYAAAIAEGVDQMLQEMAAEDAAKDAV